MSDGCPELFIGLGCCQIILLCRYDLAPWQKRRACEKWEFIFHTPFNSRFSFVRFSQLVKYTYFSSSSLSITFSAKHFAANPGGTGQQSEKMR